MQEMKNMYGGIKTSLLSLVCGAAVSVGAMAAPTVRTVGGDGTYPSAASATSARAGSLRATGMATGGLRPSVSTASATAPLSDSSTVTGSVSAGGGTVGRVASSPRLSIGKYIGAPKSVSTTPADGNTLKTDIEKLQTDFEDLRLAYGDKQDVLHDSEYITIEDNELVLDLDKIRTDLAVQDGRTVEMGTNDTGLLWRYVGESDDAWHILITWESIASKLDINGINQKITDLTNAVANKLDKSFPNAEPGAALVVGADGTVTATGEFVNAKWTGTDDPGKVLVVGDDGVVTTGTYNTGVNPNDLGGLAYLGEDDLGALAWEDTVTTNFIADSAVERAKLADDIANVISWIEWWKKNAPGDIRINPDGTMTGDGMQYVLSVDQYGKAKWFRVITAPEDTVSTDPNTGGESRP